MRPSSTPGQISMRSDTPAVTLDVSFDEAFDFLSDTYGGDVFQGSRGGMISE